MSLARNGMIVIGWMASFACFEPPQEDGPLLQAIHPVELGGVDWNQSPVDSGNYVIASNAEWEAFWEPAEGPPLPADMDFGDRMIVAVVPGVRSGGQSIRISAAQIEGDSLILIAQEYHSCIGYGLSMRPWHAVIVPRFDRDVVIGNGGVWQQVCREGDSERRSRTSPAVRFGDTGQAGRR